MTQSKFSEMVRSYLHSNFPGSTIDDGYYFVSITGGVRCRVDDAFVQEIGERLAEPGSWVITVGVDPRSYVSASSTEERSVYYKPDWDVEIKLSQWLVELGEAGIKLRSLLEAE